MHSEKKSIWAWALYDAGNSAFATVIMAGFFPVFFKTYWSKGSDLTVSTAQLGMINAAGGLLLAFLAPLLGAVADGGLAKKKFLSFFTSLGIAVSSALFFVQEGNWHLAAALYVAGVIGFSGANIFYDSLLLSVSNEKSVDRTSALGFSLGYLGGGILFAFCVWIVLSPQAFSYVQYIIRKIYSSVITVPFFMESTRSNAIKLSFLLTGAWWAVFTIPLLLFVREPKAEGFLSDINMVRQGFRQLWKTFHEIRRMKHVWIFLLAYWFYIDGVNTIIRMAIDYGMSIGLEYSDLICALLITQFVGFPCALLFGSIGTKWGAKKALYTSIIGYIFILLWGMVMTNKTEFYILAGMVGVFQGGIQALSRSYYSRLIPAEKSAQYFGFYNMVGKWSVVFGPAVMGISAYLSRNPRAGIGSLSIFFITGGILLYFAEEKS